MSFLPLDYTRGWRGDDEWSYYCGSLNRAWTDDDWHLIRPVVQWDRPIFSVEVDEETVKDLSGKICGHTGVRLRKGDGLSSGQYPRPLGVNQREVLKRLKDGPWREGGWVWVSPSLTRQVLDSLVQRGLVVEVDDEWRRVL